MGLGASVLHGTFQFLYFYTITMFEGLLFGFANITISVK